MSLLPRASESVIVQPHISTFWRQTINQRISLDQKENLELIYLEGDQFERVSEFEDPLVLEKMNHQRSIELEVNKKILGFNFCLSRFKHLLPYCLDDHQMFIVTNQRIIRLTGGYKFEIQRDQITSFKLVNGDYEPQSESTSLVYRESGIKFILKDGSDDQYAIPDRQAGKFVVAYLQKS